MSAENQAVDSCTLAQITASRLEDHIVQCGAERAQADEKFEKLFDRWWLVAGSFIALLLTVIGILFVKVYG